MESFEQRCRHPSCVNSSEYYRCVEKRGRCFTCRMEGKRATCMMDSVLRLIRRRPLVWFTPGNKSIERYQIDRGLKEESLEGRGIGNLF